jgi:hypothetical protein
VVSRTRRFMTGLLGCSPKAGRRREAGRLRPR